MPTGSRGRCRPAGDVVAVLVPVLQGDDLALDEVAHPRAHSLGDIGDDVLVLLLQREEHRGDLGVLVHENFVVLLAARVDVLRVVNLLPEYLQLRALGLIRDAHVVLDGVQRAEHEVEDAHRVLQLVRQLLDDDRERPGHEVEHVVAEPEVGFLRQLLRLVRHAFHPVKRDDVPGVFQDERERAHGELSRRASNKKSNGGTADRSALTNRRARLLRRTDGGPKGGEEIRGRRGGGTGRGDSLARGELCGRGRSRRLAGSAPPAKTGSALWLDFFISQSRLRAVRRSSSPRREGRSNADLDE